VARSAERGSDVDLMSSHSLIPIANWLRKAPQGLEGTLVTRLRPRGITFNRYIINKFIDKLQKQDFFRVLIFF
jgi:hypothetical protein